MKIAGVQMDIRLRRVDDNLDKIVERLGETTRQGRSWPYSPSVP